MDKTPRLYGRLAMVAILFLLVFAYTFWSSRHRHEEAAQPRAPAQETSAAQPGTR